MAVYMEQDERGIFTTPFFYNPPSRQWVIYPFIYANTGYSDSVAQMYDPNMFMTWTQSREESETLTLRLMYVVHATLYTLNARNIYLEAVERPAKLNRKRKKRTEKSRCTGIMFSRWHPEWFARTASMKARTRYQAPCRFTFAGDISRPTRRKRQCSGYGATTGGSGCRLMSGATSRTA